MLTSRARAVTFGLLSTVLAALAMAATATASAEAGPFWHHRAVGSEGEGAKVEPTAPENFKGEGGEQTLKWEIGTTATEITAEGSQVKGALFNGPERGQFKAITVYKQPKLKLPALVNCTPMIGSNNTVQLKGHLAWKWDGTRAQRIAANQKAAGQTIEGVVTPFPLYAQKTNEEEIEKINTGNFTTLTLSGSGCGVLAGTFLVGGGEIIIPNRGLEEWSTSLANRTIPAPTTNEGQFLQHAWINGAPRGLGVALAIAGHPASLTGQNTVNFAQQEIAVFEK
jgi:hypothetical protein